MTLLFARHGQTEANLADQFQGRLDTPLTDQGKMQAENLGKFILPMQIDECILSPLPRVKETYDHVTKEKHIPFRIDERLIEICYGDWEGRTRAELDQEVLTYRNEHRFTYTYPGEYQGIPGESYALQYNERMKAFLEELVAQSSNKSILCISHQGPLLSIKKFFGNLSDEETGYVKTPNNEIYMVEITSPGNYEITSLTL